MILLSRASWRNVRLGFWGFRGDRLGFLLSGRAGNNFLISSDHPKLPHHEQAEITMPAVSRLPPCSPLADHDNRPAHKGWSEQSA